MGFTCNRLAYIYREKFTRRTNDSLVNWNIDTRKFPISPVPRIFMSAGEQELFLTLSYR